MLIFANALNRASWICDYLYTIRFVAIITCSYGSTNGCIIWNLYYLNSITSPYVISRAIIWFWQVTIKIWNIFILADMTLSGFFSVCCAVWMPRSSLHISTFSIFHDGLHWLYSTAKFPKCILGCLSNSLTTEINGFLILLLKFKWSLIPLLTSSHIIVWEIADILK